MSDINQSIVDFAKAQMGNRVGAGECWDFAEEALTQAGAKNSNDVMGAKNVVPNADYKWGTRVQLFQLKPGDIIQFKGYTYTFPGGTPGTRPHHTAIVASVGKDGVVEVYEQNISGQYVETNTLYFKSTKEVKITGQFWFYHPTVKK